MVRVDRVIPDEDPMNEYRNLNDKFPDNRVKYQRPDLSEYMMRQVRPDEVHNPNVKPYDPYHDPGPYQFGKRPKGWRP